MKKKVEISLDTLDTPQYLLDPYSYLGPRKYNANPVKCCGKAK